jgi:hypothetical protein
VNDLLYDNEVLANKNKVRESSVEVVDFLILKLAFLFLDKKDNKNLPLVIHELVCVE